ncbi:hypothetical protein GWK08_17195 [Leptobacterium flavescens]|uniref:Nuclear transport factor 2 family protein n=1 Tax=Leptobacterium flavescens TaxID=472055 RepID=A0A6P0UPW9_9FLAO|nr:hypothetical protein [Leptobacterium flavescens]NER15195.1 hypothetical protein [Leptobacterium flavescens]
MNLKENLIAMDSLVQQGQIPQAVEQFFDACAKSKDHNGAITNSKAEMLDKMDQFLGGIANVNGITLHNQAVGENVTMSEYTFDFDMKDGSKVLWNEIIKREWEGDKVVNESYFLL